MAGHRDMDLATLWRGTFQRERSIDRIVPPTGHTAWLTVAVAASMAFLAVFALALALATGRLADRWGAELAQTVTVRVTAPTVQLPERTASALEVLRTTPGIDHFELLDEKAMQDLLTPWFGDDMPVDALPIPRLIEVTENRDGIDAEGLSLRLDAEAPGAVLDDHTTWRRPLVSAASRLRLLGWFSLLLIAGASAGMLSLAAMSSLAANSGVIRVLRLIGAKDSTIAVAFVRRYTRRAALGALGGTALGMLAIFALPPVNQAGGFLTGLGYQGWGWLLPLLIPLIAAGLGFIATRWAALRIMREVR